MFLLFPPRKDPKSRLQASRLESVLSTGRDAHFIVYYSSFVFKTSYLKKVDDVQLLVSS